MKSHNFILVLLFILLQGCNSVTGPVHFYSGQALPDTDTAHLEVPAAITVTSIDGKKVKVPSKEEGFYDIYLLPGLHRIEFKYELVWGDNTSDMLIRSDVVGIETRFYAGKSYELVYRVPSDEDEAYELAVTNEFKADLLEKDTGRKVASRSISKLNQFRLPVDNVPQVPAINPQAKPATGGVTTPKGVDANTASREDAVKRLKFWWLMANEDEKKQFRKWMESIEMGQ